VRRRERSKSIFVKAIRAIKRGYVGLAARLVDAGRLPDEDAIFFLSEDEIGRLVAGPGEGLVERALARRRDHARKMELRFPRVSVGRPEPLPPGADPSAEGGDSAANEVIEGTPVSRGSVIGLARVARTPEEAASLRRGEILIVPYTDVGWAPYFAVAGGLATEIGGTLSHGAVVAREYGLPAVVNLPNATRIFRTGDRVLLDGDAGVLRRIAPGRPDPR
jgi:pyruvate,water dikinase